MGALRYPNGELTLVYPGNGQAILFVELRMVFDTIFSGFEVGMIVVLLKKGHFIQGNFGKKTIKNLN